MPDNRRLIQKRLGMLGLAPRREEEIFRELGEHLEDHAAALEARGAAGDEAIREALGSVCDWPALRNDIVLAETEEAFMNYRTKVFWLPALCTALVTYALLRLFQFVGFVPHFYWFDKGMSMGPYLTFYVPWLIALLFIGAGGAFWSQRAGGKVLHRLLAALAPPLGILGGFLAIPVITPLIYMYMSLFRHRHVHGGFSLIIFLTGFLISFLNWVLMPAIPLLVGAAPFLRKPHPQA